VDLFGKRAAHVHAEQMNTSVHKFAHVNPHKYTHMFKGMHAPLQQHVSYGRMASARRADERRPESMHPVGPGAGA